MDILGLYVGKEIFSAPALFMIGIGLFWMVIASIQDIRKREVENWWNFSCSYRQLYSLHKKRS